MASIQAASNAMETDKGSDDEWEDMDMDGDSDQCQPKGKNAKRVGRLKTDNEKFFKDL